MKRLATLTALFVILASFFAGVTPSAAASTNYVQITGISGTSCIPGDFVTVELFFVAGTGSLTHLWTDDNLSQSTSTSNSALIIGPESGIPGNWSIGVPANTQDGDTLKITVIVPSSDSGETGSLSSITFNCLTGAILGQEFIMDYSVGDPGPSIPDGFVLRTITCDVAVFDAPNGNPVGDNRLKAGQTFFVSADSTADATGAKWSQVFVSSRVNPWIPTKCIGGAPAGY